jgi:hypothetical protein
VTTTSPLTRLTTFIEACGGTPDHDAVSAWGWDLPRVEGSTVAVSLNPDIIYRHLGIIRAQNAEWVEHYLGTLECLISHCIGEVAGGVDPETALAGAEARLPDGGLEIYDQIRLHVVDKL